MSQSVKIAVVGSGYVGLVAAVCFAEMGHEVWCVDNDESKVAALRAGDTLIHENHLPELMERYRNTRVRFTTDLAEATSACDAIFIAVGTPQSDSGDADLSSLGSSSQVQTPNRAKTLVVDEYDLDLSKMSLEVS